ncbi:MAG: hypothetical protein FD174_1386 [Geobacteraceae bacterium]|nr:MAG: hypothetical protein FD174_1386 [Geobacteraceae bacterium]
MDVSKKVKEYFGSALAVYLIMFALYYFTVKKYFSGPAENMSKCGVFGDMFGGFNALFSGLGFIAVAVTIYLQIEQHKRDKEESHRYQVENTFFNMLSTLREIVRDSYYEREGSDEAGDEINGPVYLKLAIKILKGKYKIELYNRQKELYEADKTLKTQYQFVDKIPLAPEAKRDAIVKVYEDFYTKHEHNLGHYFRYLYNIFKYIITSFEGRRDIAGQYIGLIQAQMSNDELGLTFYNAISKHSKNLQQQDVFRQWLDDFDFFENIDERCIFDDAFIAFFPKTHFKYKLRKDAEAGEAVKTSENGSSSQLMS